ncbi:MAG: 2-hydroxyglutaryl-CoA dehydratase, partial [Candidatus Tectomicrobia bacterium]|nr:2-hydroxyglutaryl-CoA dehydratase [Candidatus Tectomicrobia bacterium]
MIVAGVDMGAQAAKVVILKDRKIIGQAIGQAATSMGWDIEAAGNRAVDEACHEAGIDRHHIQKIIATGVGRRDVPFANEFVTEVSALAAAGGFLFPSVHT